MLFYFLRGINIEEVRLAEVLYQIFFFHSQLPLSIHDGKNCSEFCATFLRFVVKIKDKLKESLGFIKVKVFFLVFIKHLKNC